MEKQRTMETSGCLCGNLFRGQNENLENTGSQHLFHATLPYLIKECNRKCKHDDRTDPARL